MKKMSFMFKTILLTMGITFAGVIANPLYAQDGAEFYLRLIAQYTHDILVKVNELPTYLEPVTVMALSWMSSKDDSNFIGKYQEAAGTLTAKYPAWQNEQLQFSKNSLNFYLKPYPNSELNNINELSYSTMFNQLPLLQQGLSREQQEKNLAQYKTNYMLYTAGANYILPPAEKSWKDSDAKRDYINIYNIIAATKSFNLYIIHELNEQKEKQELTAKLVNLASSSDWFTQIASEKTSLGLIFRETLLFNSQIFVQLTRLLDLQQKQLEAQIMANNLLSINLQETAAKVLRGQANPSSAPGVPAQRPIPT